MAVHDRHQPIDEESVLWGSRRRNVEPPPITTIVSQNARAETLKNNLDSIQKEVEVIQTSIKDNAQLSIKVQQLSDLITQTKQTSQELTAPVKLPPLEDMEVQLVPTHSLERLEEYRADENRYSLLIGLFGGAILGIFSNWFTNENLVITRFSVTFIILLVLLTSGSIMMSIRNSRRAQAIKNKMTRKDSQTRPIPEKTS